MTQEELRQGLLNDIAELEQRSRRLLELSPGQREWRPPSGGWGVADVLDHLVTTDEAYATPMEALVAEGAGRGRADAPRREWRGCWAGRFLVASLRKERRLPAPKKYQPAAAPRPDVVEAWLADLARIRGMIERSAGLDWRALKLRSPAMPLMVLNLGDCYLTAVVHSRRHFGQIDRVRQSPGFPAR